jgi:hypothetical protein
VSAPCPRCAAPDQFNEPFCSVCAMRLLPGDVADEGAMHQRSIAWEQAHPDLQAAWIARVEAHRIEMEAQQARAAALAMAVARIAPVEPALPAAAVPPTALPEEPPIGEPAVIDEQVAPEGAEPEGTWRADAPARRRSPWKAMVLGVVSGAGHLYVRERLRASTFVLAAAAVAVGALLGHGDAGLVALGLAAPLVLASMFDARRAAKAYNEARPARGINFGVVGIVAIGAASLSLGITSNLDRSTPARLAEKTVTTAGTAAVSSTTLPSGDNGSAIAEQVKPNLQRAIQAKVTDATVTVKTVDCLARTDTTGSCSVYVVDSLGNKRTFPLDYRVASAGNVRWKITAAG